MELTSQKSPRRNTPPAFLSSSEPDRRPQRKRDRTAKQQALMNAAKKLFVQRGYDATTTREIAAHAGCAEGLIHRYFKGKAGLFLALIEHCRSQERTRSTNNMSPSTTFEDAIVSLADEEIQQRWDDREFLKVIIPRALHDPAVGKLLFGFATPRNVRNIVERLRRLPNCTHMENNELEAYARLVELVGFSFGFLRPVLMAQDSSETRKVGLFLTKTLLSRRSTL